MNPSATIFILKSITKFLDLIYPPVCINCGKEGYLVCSECIQEIDYIQPPDVNPLIKPSINSHYQSSYIYLNTYLDSLHSVSFYKGVIRKCILSLKYERNIGLGLLLAELLAKEIESYKWNLDMIVPVPLGRKRLLERGFNQSAAVAFPLAKLLDLKYDARALHKIKETSSQVGLSREERWKNVENAFFADRLIVKGKNVMIFDDVYTTGATINACSKALKNAGVNKVFGLTLAKALYADNYQNL